MRYNPILYVADESILDFGIPAFAHTSVQEIKRRDAQKRRMKRVLEVVAHQYLLTSERKVLEIVLYSNHSVQEIYPFVKTNARYLARRRIRRVLKLLSKFVQYFDNYPYKKIQKVAQEVLTTSQYEFLISYLRLHSYRRVALLYGISIQAVQGRIQTVLKRLNTRKEETAPLIDLIEFLKNYRYQEYQNEE